MARVDIGADYVIRGVAAPENNNDAVNKGYVDSRVSGGTTYNLLARALAGGGSLVLDGSDGSEDLVGLVGGEGVTITHTPGGNTLTFTSDGGGATVTRSPTPPTDAAAGDLWLRTTDSRLFIANGNIAWIHIGDTINRLTGEFGFTNFNALPAVFADFDSGDFSYKVFQYEIDGGTI